MIGDTDSTTFVHIVDRPVINKVRNMFIVDTVREDREVLGFRTEFHPEVDTLVHIDSIAFKTMLVPHYSSEHPMAEKMCAIRMWESR